MNEARYSALAQSNPERANELFDLAAKTAEERYEKLLALQEMFGKQVEK